MIVRVVFLWKALFPGDIINVVSLFKPGKVLILSLLKKSLVFLLPLLLLACSSASVKDDEMDIEAVDIFDELEESDEAEGDNKSAYWDANDDADRPFYTAVGGEGWRRLAKALYNDIGAVEELKELNPDIQGHSRLEAGMNVYFDIEKAMPRPEYLTKDMIERYKAILAEKIVVLRNQTYQDLQEIKVNSGDTLQIISQKLYGTHRLWPELFLLNTDKTDHYDKIHPGMVLSYFPKVDFPSVGGGTLAFPSQPSSPGVKAEAPTIMDERAEDEYMGTVQPEEVPFLEENEGMGPPVETGMNEEIPEAMDALPPPTQQASMRDKTRKTIRSPPLVKKDAMATMKDRQEKMKAAVGGIVGKIKNIFPKGMDGRTTLYGLLIFVALVGGAFFFIIKNRKKKSSKPKPKLSPIGKAAFTFPFEKSSSEKTEDDVSPIRKIQ